MNEAKVLDAAMIEQMLALLPAQEQARLFMLATDEGATDEQVEQAAREALESIDWATQRDQIRELISRIMPLETLVPDVYAAWRPVIRDAVAWTGSRLSTERLVPKLVEQMLLPAEMPLEQRLLMLIARMPGLQKLGQIVARNPNLAPSFRDELTRLENSIQDITPDEIRAEIERQLGKYLKIYRVELEDVNLAEASVSAAVRFTWFNPVTRRREQGVFKVLKPYVLEYFPEEMAILQGLADFFDTNRDNYDLPPVGLREVMDDVRRLLEWEVNLPAEQAHLTAAYERYKNVRGVRVPRLLRELSTPTITAMSEEEGVKVTDAYPDDEVRRKRLAGRMIKALIAVPMFAPEEESFFHADPHAGNLFADEQTGELIILDWALVERLSREQRRQTVLLTLGVALRDERRIFDAIAALSEDDLRADATRASIVRGHVARFFDRFALLEVPGFAEVMTLLDGIAFSGVRFPAELLMFRKVLFTLEGVLHDVAPDIKIDLVLARYALKLLPAEAPARLLRPLTDPSATFRTHLSNYDLTALVLSIPLLGHRLWLQTAERITERGLAELQRALFRLQGDEVMR
ncbi:MAG: AarF/UbiB family protein [Ardenticatenaceae bacterium]